MMTTPPPPTPRSLGVGPAEGPFAEAPMAALVQHINREMIHHLAEVALLRDLWAHRYVHGGTL